MRVTSLNSFRSMQIDDFSFSEKNVSNREKLSIGLAPYQLISAKKEIEFFLRIFFEIKV